MRGRRVLRGCLESLDQREILEKWAPKVRKVHKEIPALQGLLVLLAPKARRVSRGYRVSKVRKAILANKVLKVLKAQRVLKALKVRKAPRGRKVSLVWWILPI